MFRNFTVDLFLEQKSISNARHEVKAIRLKKDERTIYAVRAGKCHSGPISENFTAELTPSTIYLTFKAFVY